MASLCRQNGITVVELDERYDSLDEETLGHLSDLLLEAASESDPPALLIDFSQTEFVGSLFIGLLVRVWKRIRDRNGSMGLCCIPAFCREALTAARLYDTLWTPYGTREEAIAAMK